MISDIEAETSLKSSGDFVSESESLLTRNSEEVEEIITAPPSWILRRGTALIFAILLGLVLLSAFIEYPDVLKASLKVNSLNAPKSVYAKQSGKIVKFLVADGSEVQQDQPLAFMESTASHHDVLSLHNRLGEFSQAISRNGFEETLEFPSMNLGELQGAFQVFYQHYLQFVSTKNGGYYLQRKEYLLDELEKIEKLQGQIMNQKLVKEQEYANMEQDYRAFKKLHQKKVISDSEFRQQENKYLAGKYPLQQIATELLNNANAYTSKQKEIIDIEHTIKEERSKFMQALNQILSETNGWLNKYVSFAPIKGVVVYNSLIQQNQTVAANEELFIVSPVSTQFYGEVQVPQHNMGKIREGQRVLVKMRSYPFEQFGLIRGKVSHLSEVAFRDSVFIARVGFDRFEIKDARNKINLKTGMLADAEIITEESTLLQRFTRNITGILNK